VYTGQQKQNQLTGVQRKFRMTYDEISTYLKNTLQTVQSTWQRKEKEGLPSVSPLKVEAIRQAFICGDIHGSLALFPLCFQLF
jgi:hypothetical protein